MYIYYTVIYIYMYTYIYCNIHIHIHVVSNSGKLILSILAFQYQMIFLLDFFFWLAVCNCHLYHMFSGNRTPSGESFPWELGMLFQSCLVKSQWTYGKKLEAKSAPTPDNSYIVLKKNSENMRWRSPFPRRLPWKNSSPLRSLVTPFVLPHCHCWRSLASRNSWVSRWWGWWWVEGVAWCADMRVCLGIIRHLIYIYIYIEMLFCWCCHRWLMNLVSFVDWVWSCFRNKVQNRNDKMDREDDNISRFLHPNSESKNISILEISSGAISNTAHPAKKWLGIFFWKQFRGSQDLTGRDLIPGFPPKNHNDSAAEPTDFEEGSSSIGWWRGGLYLSHYQGGPLLVSGGHDVIRVVFFREKCGVESKRS